VTCAAVRADDVVVILQNGAGFVDVGQFAVGEDKNSFHRSLSVSPSPPPLSRMERGLRRKHPHGGGCSIVKKKIPPPALPGSGVSGRAFYAPLSLFDHRHPVQLYFSYMTCGLFCQPRSLHSKFDNVCGLNAKSANPTLPLLFHLQFTGACARVERKEVCEQAIEFDRFFNHREVP